MEKVIYCTLRPTSFRQVSGYFSPNGLIPNYMDFGGQIQRKKYGGGVPFAAEGGVFAALVYMKLD